MGKLINIDNGGTLTDICVIDGKKIYHTKTITTPYDLSKCFIEGMKKAAVVIYGEDRLVELLQSTDHIRYSTTQGTNALVQRKGPPIGLVLNVATNLDLLTGGGREGALYQDLVGQRLERIDTNLTGEAFTNAVVEVLNRLTGAGAQRIVVSFMGDEGASDEARFNREALRMFPRHLLGVVPINYAQMVSADVDFGRRTWTALCNAFLHPVMERFLYHAESLLRPHRMRHPLLVYRNDGFSGRVVKTTALKTYSSGPRAGMEAARVFADYYGIDRLLSFDVGGTTTDIGLVECGQIRRMPRGVVEGVHCSFPLSDIVSVGVGGGSIFRVVDGQIKVGPDSVGGAPGPACFALGGQHPTITDALLLMGLLDPTTYFGGSMKLDSARARNVIEKELCTPLQKGLAATVHAMLDAWAAAIARDLLNFSAVTPETALIAFGGGGPLAVLVVAEALGVQKVLVPRLAAVFSAYGIGFSDIAHTAERCLTQDQIADVSDILSQLKDQALSDMFSEGFEPEECRLEASLTTEAGEIPIDVESLTLPNPSWSGIATLVVRAIKTVSHGRLAEKFAPEKIDARPDGSRSLVAADGTLIDLPVFRVELLIPGAIGTGPAVLEEAYWTCQVPSDWTFEITCNGDIQFHRKM